MRAPGIRKLRDVAAMALFGFGKHAELRKQKSLVVPRVRVMRISREQLAITLQRSLRKALVFELQRSGEEFVPLGQDPLTVP